MGLGEVIQDNLRGISIFLNGRLGEPISPLRVGKISSLSSQVSNSLSLNGLRGTIFETVFSQYSSHFVHLKQVWVKVYWVI